MRKLKQSKEGRNINDEVNATAPAVSLDTTVETDVDYWKNKHLKEKEMRRNEQQIHRNSVEKKEQILLLQQNITEKDTEILETDPVVMDLVEVPVTIAETMTGEEGGEDHPEMIKTPGVLTGGKTETEDPVEIGIMMDQVLYLRLIPS